MTSANQTKAKSYRKLGSAAGFMFPLATEALAERFHLVYQDEARRQTDQDADSLRHPDEYSELAERTKDYDRALARFVLEQRATSTMPGLAHSHLEVIRSSDKEV